jgi:hypothetical protein
MRRPVSVSYYCVLNEAGEVMQEVSSISPRIVANGMSSRSVIWTVSLVASGCPVGDARTSPSRYSPSLVTDSSELAKGRVPRGVFHAPAHPPAPTCARQLGARPLRGVPTTNVLALWTECAGRSAANNRCSRGPRYCPFAARAPCTARSAWKSLGLASAVNTRLS